MEYKSPISIRVGKRTELDQTFAKCIESLPEGINLSEEIKMRFVLSYELEEGKSEIGELKEQVARQAELLRRLEAQIKSGVTVEEQKCDDRQVRNLEEEQIRRVQELAASMTDW